MIFTLIWCYGDSRNPIFFSEAHGTLISSYFPFNQTIAPGFTLYPHFLLSLPQKRTGGDMPLNWELRYAGGFLTFTYLLGFIIRFVLYFRYTSSNLV